MTSHSNIGVTPGEFERRLAAHGHSPAEIQRLWQELAAPELETEPPTGRMLGLPWHRGKGPVNETGPVFRQPMSA